MVEFLGIQVELLAGVLIPVGAGVAIITWRAIRYLINKDKCLTIFKDRLKTQEQETKNGKETHKDIYLRLNSIDKNVAKIMGRLGIDED